ncbi:hypothetical protein F1880_005264, partial [Penicillium rolfsii]
YGGKSFYLEVTVEDQYLLPVPNSDRLTQRTLILISGRLGDVYDYRELFLVGAAWLAIKTLAKPPGGLREASTVPNAVALTWSKTPPGRVRNFSLGLFGVSAPIGITLVLFSWLYISLTMEQLRFQYDYPSRHLNLSTRETPVDQHENPDLCQIYTRHRGVYMCSCMLVPRTAAERILALVTYTVLFPNVTMAAVPDSQGYWTQIIPFVILFSFGTRESLLVIQCAGIKRALLNRSSVLLACVETTWARDLPPPLSLKVLSAQEISSSDIGQHSTLALRSAP